MKKKGMVTALAAVIAMTTAGTAYAATGTKTATLNNAQVRFNGGTVQTIQCYNIDGYNYVRARDVTNNLNMKVAAYQNGQNGIAITPEKAATSAAATEKLTQQTAKVNVVTGEISYDGIPYQAECFLLNGRYYFKLADFASASDYDLEVVMECIEIEANGDIAKEPYKSVHSGIGVEWNADTKVISVDKVETDLQAIFDEIRGTSSTAKADKEETKKDTSSKKEDTFKATGVLTSAPKEGKILANILIDEEEGAYLADGSVNWDNLTKPYTLYPESYVGQCTWYAEGRLMETTGVNVYSLWGGGVETWVEKAQSGKDAKLDGTTDKYDIEAGCIAVFKGHVLFVEWVDFDDEGNPETVYFTEGNTQRNGTYNPDKDGKVQVMSFDKFIARQEFIGYVIAK